MFLMKERGVELSIVHCDPSGSLDMDAMARMIRKDTKAVIINHGSNVIGSVQPLGEIKRAIGDAFLIVDACQTIGAVPIDIKKDNIDIICFSCHKSLFAIQGLGALYIREGIEPTPLKFGGTGSKSESMEHPEFLPDRYECGTPNTPGIASLLGGLSFIEKEGLTRISKRKIEIRERFIRGLSGIDRVTTLSDHRDVAFGKAFGVLLKDLRLLARCVWVIDRGGIVRYVQLVPEIALEPDYGPVLEAARQLLRPLGATV
jgi:selenocysteine lyase/cysteine desulfurase